MKPPNNPQEAEERLAELVRQMQRHLDEYESHETFVSADLMGWFIAAVNEQLGGKRNLEQALGLVRGRGRPKDKEGEGRYFTLALRIHEMRESGLSWNKIAEKEGIDPKELRDIYARNESAVLKHIAKQVSAKVAARGDKSRHLTAKPER